MSYENISWSCWIRCLLACGGAFTMDLFIGVCEAQSTVMLLRLQEPDSPIKITQEEATWITSLGFSAAPFSSILCGPLSDYFGRKLVIQSYYLVSGLGFACIAAATCTMHLYIGRILCSVGLGLHIVDFVYIAEVCTPRQRSVCMAQTMNMFAAGIVLAHLVAATLPWNIGSALYALLCLLLFIYVWFTPESPPWLVKKGKIDRAVYELKRLGRNEVAIQQEINVLQTSVAERTKHEITWRSFLHPTVWKPFLIMCVFHILQAATGIYNLVFYTVDFVGQLGTEADPFLVSTGLAIGRFLGIFIFGAYFMINAKRKISTAVSGFLMALTLLIAAAYEYQYDVIPISQRPNTWIPILAVLASAVVSTIGVIHLPWTMSGEVFPLHLRGTMGGAVLFVGSVCVFIFLKSYLFFLETLKITGVLVFHGVSAIAVGLFGIFILTETQNRSLQDIEASYVRKNKSKDSSQNQQTKL